MQAPKTELGGAEVARASLLALSKDVEWETSYEGRKNKTLDPRQQPRPAAWQAFPSGGGGRPDFPTLSLWFPARGREAANHDSFAVGLFYDFCPTDII